MRTAGCPIAIKHSPARSCTNEPSPTMTAKDSLWPRRNSDRSAAPATERGVRLQVDTEIPDSRFHQVL